MDETFECDRCGKSFPRDQLKEAYIRKGDKRYFVELDPYCLDEVMQGAENIEGAPGKEKDAAAEILLSETDESFDLDRARELSQGEAGLEEST